MPHRAAAVGRDCLPLQPRSVRGGEKRETRYWKRLDTGRAPNRGIFRRPAFRSVALFAPLPPGGARPLAGPGSGPRTPSSREPQASRRPIDSGKVLDWGWYAPAPVTPHHGSPHDRRHDARTAQASDTTRNHHDNRAHRRDHHHPGNSTAAHGDPPQPGTRPNHRRAPRNTHPSLFLSPRTFGPLRAGPARRCPFRPRSPCPQKGVRRDGPARSSRPARREKKRRVVTERPRRWFGLGPGGPDRVAG